MIEAGEDLPFIPKMAQHRIRVHAALDDLDRDLLFVLLVGTLGQINRTHSAAAKLTNHAVWPD